MSQNDTTTTGRTPTDPCSLFLEILQAATCQDGTLETAREALHTIEDLSLAGVRSLRQVDPDIKVTLAALDRMEDLCAKALAILDAR